MAKSSIAAIDWITVLLFILLVGFGWGNIYSSSYSDEVFSITDLSQVYSKQGLWIVLSIFLIIVTQAIEVKFYEGFAGVIFVGSLVSLLGLFVFGKTISGATSWYNLGFMSIQPSEFAKAATALALAKFLSDMQTNIKRVNHQLKAFLIIALPALIIVPQPDPGSALVYAAFFFPLYREGLAPIYLIIGASAAILFVATLLFGPLLVVIGAVLFVLGFLMMQFMNLHHERRSRTYTLIIIVILALCVLRYTLSMTTIVETLTAYLEILVPILNYSILGILALVIGFFIGLLSKGTATQRQKPNYLMYIATLAVIVGFCYSVSYIYTNVFEERHRNRFDIVLGKAVDAKGIGYNTNQSQIAIGSGGWFGKGWKEGTQTKGGFVPEQHTDYIFSTVGEEWGFLGSTLVILLFVFLLIRLLILAERQKSQFSRVYGYSVVGVLFVHFAVNVGMVIGLLPTVGIPLPFFSYGGSGLWGFTVLLFIFIKLDANRVNEW